MQKADIEVKVFKLIAYLEVLRKSINIPTEEDDIGFDDKDKLSRY